MVEMKKEGIKMTRKRIVLKTMKPLCKIFKIKYEYVYLQFSHLIEEILYLNGKAIKCTKLTPEEIRDKVLSYIFVEEYCSRHSIGAFKKQTLNVIKKDWLK